MIFQNVNDISIPQGNVIKIQETNSGRILWQKFKPLNPKWLSLSSGDIASNRNTNELVISCISKNVSFLSSDSITVLRSCFFPASSSVLAGSACAPIFWKRPDDFVISGSGGRYSGGPAYFYYPNGQFFSASDDGSLLFSKSDSGYQLVRFNNNSSKSSFPTNNPRNETSVYISYSPEKHEYLVNGIKGGSFTLPYSFGPSTSINPSGFNLAKSIWVAPLNKYFALNYIPSKFCYFSQDGLNWIQSMVFASGNVADIVWLSKKGLLCALNSSKQKIALSSDGLSWIELDVPFSNPLCAAYSPELDLLAVVNNNSAYLSYNLNDWTKVVLPKNVDFRELIHVNFGFFVGYAYKSDSLFILSPFDNFILDAHS